MKKKLLWILLTVISLIVIAVVLLISGVLVKPTRTSLAAATPVEHFDLLEFQQQRELEILADYANGSYSPAQPYIIQDPYQANPLSAVILFETAEPAQVSVTVNGRDSSTTFSYPLDGFATHHEVAVLGLYAGEDNRVDLLVESPAGTETTFSHVLKTEPLPFDFPNLKVSTSLSASMEPGVDLMIACLETNYSYLLDANGEVRGYFSNKFFGHCTTMRILANGRLLATGDVQKLMPYNMYTLWEMNLLGKVFTEYEIPNAVHHDIVELPDGDFLAVSNNAGMPWDYDTREDVIIRIDRQTGLVTDEYDLRKVLDERRAPYHHYDAGVQNSLNRDWAHTNSAVMDEKGESIVISSPIQSAVVKFDADTFAIDWILSPHEGWDGEFARFQPYLLTPVGRDFEWQWGQHTARILPDEDGDPDTVDILLFDNGQAKSTTQEGSLDPAQNYSRAVIYRVNEADMTVEQVWQYGKELGAGAYATFLGGVELLPQTGNLNIAFGGMLRLDGVPVDDIIGGVLGKQQVQSRVVEVRRDGRVVFDVSVTPNNAMNSETYQVRKIELYTPAVQYLLGQNRGIRLGEVQGAHLMEYRLPPFFIPRLTVDFSHFYQQGETLVVQGHFQYQDKTYLLGRVLFVLKNRDRQYIFPTNPGVNGNFSGRIDLSQVEPGEYALYVAGGVAEGTDAGGKVKPGYNPTGYKVVVP